jgi:hypothetical protein
MDIEMEAPVDDLEILSMEEDDDQLGDAVGSPSNNPTQCS